MHPDLVGAERSYRLVEMDILPVDLDAGTRLDRIGDIGGGHRAEEPALLAGPRRYFQPTRDQFRGERLELDLLFRHPSDVSPLQALGVLQGTLLGLDGQAAGHEEVPRISVGDVDDVPGIPELLYGLLQDDLHREEYGSRAISRAFLTAVATSRWC